MTTPSLDVLIALVTVYIVLALTVSTITEILARLVGLRSIGLRSGIRSILQDPAIKLIAKETTSFWNSGVVKSATDGDSSPISLDALTFSTATLSSIGIELPRDAAQAKALIAAAPLNAHLIDVLTGLADRAIHRGTSLHDELAQHFDATMEKIARWYRHWTQGIAFLLAICLTVFLNANTFDLLHQLTARPEARLELAKIRSELTKNEKDVSAAGRPDAATTSQLEEAYKLISNDTLGNWPSLKDDKGEYKKMSEISRLLAGLLMTILAVSLGAPFWFDVLGRLTQKPSGTNRPPSSVSLQPTAAIPAPIGDVKPASTIGGQG